MQSKLVLLTENALLRSRSAICDPCAPETRQLALSMWETVSKIPCVGAAAIQFGVANRLFLATIPPNANSSVYVIGEKPEDKLRFGVFINPQIVYDNGVVTYQVESCISIPKTNCLIGRFQEIKVCYQTLDSSQKRYLRLKGRYSKIFQHEYDHLEGVLITDKHREPRSFLKNPKHIEEFEKDLKEL